jgi:hypothetical protein
VSFPVQAQEQGCARHDAPAAALLRSFAVRDVQLGAAFPDTGFAPVSRGAVMGRPAVIKRYDVQHARVLHDLRDEVRLPLVLRCPALLGGRFGTCGAVPMHSSLVEGDTFMYGRRHWIPMAVHRNLFCRCSPPGAWTA